MRGILRATWYTCLGLVSLDSAIWIIDWLGRWDWLNAFMSAHSQIAQFFHSPLPYLFFMVLGLTSLWAEKRIKEPHIVARYVNLRAIPDPHSATMQMVFDTEQKKPGWDEARFDWDWFVEVQMVNDSETRTTLDRLEAEIYWGPKWKRKEFEFRHLEDLDSFDMDMTLSGQGKGHGQRVFGERYRPIPDLMAQIKGVPLEQEIGYQGWLHFKVFQVNQREMSEGKIKINIWIVDAKQRKHKLNFKKKDAKTWDNNFYIGKKSGLHKNRK
jgi:hypothetical protein